MAQWSRRTSIQGGSSQLLLSHSTITLPGVDQHDHVLRAHLVCVGGAGQHGGVVEGGQGHRLGGGGGRGEGKGLCGLEDSQQDEFGEMARVRRCFCNRCSSAWQLLITWVGYVRGDIAAMMR